MAAQLRENQRACVWVFVCSFVRVREILVCVGGTSSVTRFGEISPLWQKFTSRWQIFDCSFLIWKMLSLLSQICDIIGLVFFVANGQILKNYPTIWSHWEQENIVLECYKDREGRVIEIVCQFDTK